MSEHLDTPADAAETIGRRRHPSIAEACRARNRRGDLPAKPNGWTARALWLQAAAQPVDLEVAAVVVDLVLRPKPAQYFNSFFKPADPLAFRNAEGVELLVAIPHPHTEDEIAFGDPIERCCLLCDDRRV